MDSLTRSLRAIPAGPVVAVLAVGGLWLMSVRPDAVARVPDLEGLSVEAAQVTAAQDGYTTRVLLRQGPGRAGTVLDQVPEPQGLLARGAAIELAVTRGARQVGVPDVRGMPVNEARKVLASSELSAGDVTYRRDTGKESNRVISTDPPPGATVDVGTPVHLLAAT